MKKLLALAFVAASLCAQAQEFKSQAVSIGGVFEAQKDTNILIGGQFAYDIGGSDVFTRISAKVADNKLFVEAQVNFVLKEVPNAFRLNATASGGLAYNQNGKNPGFYSVGAEAQIFLNGNWKTYVFAKYGLFTVKANIPVGVGLAYILNK